MGGSLSITQFENLMIRVDPTLTKQEIAYIFNKIAATGSKTISYD